MLVLVILAVVWAAVLVPPILRNRREGRPSSSVVSFRAQLSTLERAMPGRTLRPAGDGSPSAYSARRRPNVSLASPDVRRRRRDVLVGLGGASAFTFLLAVAVGGMAILLFLICAGALGAYVYALRQLHLRAQERAVKVRPLMMTSRTPAAVPAPVMTLRRTATN